jgi:hypothetical protein
MIHSSHNRQLNKHVGAPLFFVPIGPHESRLAIWSMLYAMAVLKSSLTIALRTVLHVHHLEIATDLLAWV